MTFNFHEMWGEAKTDLEWFIGTVIVVFALLHLVCLIKERRKG